MGKQGTPITPVPYQFGFASGMNSDIDPKDAKQGNFLVSAAYTGAVNMRSIGAGLNVSPGYEPVEGNTYSYQPEAAVEQNKLFRLYVDLTFSVVAETPDFTYTLSTPSGAVLFTDTDTITISDVATALTDIETILLAGLTAFTPVTSVVQTGTYTGYIEIEFTDTPHFNYDLEVVVDTTSLQLTVETTQEPVDVSMVGYWQLIGSDDRTGDDFQFWTTRRGLPYEIEILNITNPSGSIVQVETLTPHNLAENQSVRIQGVLGTVEANGDWIAVNVTAYTFELALCVYVGAYLTGGVMYGNIYGLGEIGVAIKNDLDEIEYTRLLRSMELNFSALHQIDVRVKRKQDENKCAYFTDKFNFPRAFYYKGEYLTDGALSPNGIYEYGTIASELRWVQSNSDFSLAWIDQIQTGGAVKSGNWRYAARLLTSNFVETQWSLLTEGVPVYSYNYQSAPLVIGDVANEVTPKINVLELTNNAVGLFKYVEIAAINYNGSLGFNATILGRYELNGQTTQIIEHTGNENALIDLDAGELNDFSPGFILAQNVELLDNRAILSNLTPAQTLDFTSWVENFKYALEREGLTPIGVWSTGALTSGEYQLPENVYSKKSHMMYDQYRYGFRFKLKSGGYTQVFYPGYDIRIDLPTTPLPPERIAGSFTTFDLTDNAAPPTEVYSIYINWLNIDLSYLIDGIPVYDLIDEIIPCRATVIPEVLGHGVVIMGVNGLFNVIGPAAGSPDDGRYGPNTAGPNYAIGPYPFVSGNLDLASDVYPGTFAPLGSTDMNAVRTSAFFYCPDISWKLNDIDFTAGDVIVPFGNPERHNQNNTSGIANLVCDSYYSEFNGYTGIATNPSTVAITEAQTMEFNDSQPISQTSIPASTIINSNSYNLTFLVSNGGIFDYPFLVDRCFACDLGVNTITDSGPHTDYGFYRAIYFRSQLNKYGDPDTTVYTEFNEPIAIGTNREVMAYGDVRSYGDCFTQKTYLKFRYPGWFGRLQGSQNDGYGSGFAYYTQNRNNLQLRTKPTADYNDSAVIQQLPIISWLIFGYADPASTAAGNNLFYPLFRDSQLFYNKGYTPRNEIVSARAFDTTLEYQRDWGNFIAWSDVESEGSNTDNLRVFPPFNIKVLDFSDGAITEAKAVNGELVTVQPRAVIRQYFNTTAVITTQDGGEAQLGTGAVLSRRGTVMNQFGSDHKWSVIVGLSEKGHDVLYGWDAINKVMWRLGYDGTVALESLAGMKSFFANYANWVRTKDTPAYGEGISGVANQRFREAIWTFRGQKPVPEWAESETEVTILNFDDIVYGDEMVTNGNFSAPNPPGNPVPVQDISWAYGWEDSNPATDEWLWVPFSTTYGAPHAAFLFTTAVGDYLQPTIAVPFVAGETYQIFISMHLIGAVDPTVRMQLPGSVVYTISTAGDHYFTYVAQGGDDGIYIFGPGGQTTRVRLISCKRIISISNWTGAPTWLIGSNQATADGSDGDDLVQNVSPYIVANDAYTLDFITDGRTAGQITVEIGNAVSGAIATNGSQTVALTPTATGVVSFRPSGSFDGTVKGNMRLTRIHTTTYYLGDIVSVTGTTTFEEFPDLYECIVAEVPGGSFPPAAPESWQLIPHTDPRYYSEFTIVYAENKDKWQMFLTPKPKIYAKFLDSYLVPRPVGNTGRMYIADKGLWGNWFEDDASVQQSEAYIDPVINQPSGRKRYLAARIESEIAPSEMRVFNPNGIHKTFNAQMVRRENGEFDAFVTNDSTASGVSTGDTSVAWGDYAVFRFIVNAGIYNKINSFIAKVRLRSRMWFR